MSDISSAEYAALANDAYRDGDTGQCMRWERYAKRVGTGDGAGLFCAAYITRRSRKFVFAIRGTEITDRHDVRHDARLYAGFGEPWLLYSSALGFFDMFNAHLKGWASEVSVCGHSLGGGLAAMIGAARGVPAVTFNCVALSEQVRTLHATAKQNRPFGSNIVHFRNPLDIASGIWSTRFGRTIEVRKESLLHRVIRGGPVSPADGVHHGMLALTEALQAHPHGSLNPFSWPR